MENKYRLKTKIIIKDTYYTIYDTQSGKSEKQAKFEFYQRIKTYFKINTIKFTQKVVCELIKEDIKTPILDLGFKNFKVEF